MYGSRLVTGLAATFAATAVLFGIFGIVYNLGFFVVAALFGAVAYFMWYHASGRFARRLYRGVEERADPGTGAQRGGFGAGPREDWEPPRDENARRRARAAQGQGVAGGSQRQQRRASVGGRRRRAAVGGQGSGPTAAEAYDTLGLDPSADSDAVKAAYREKVKEVHPDSPGGDEDQFKAVQSAYERLTDD